jgi:hypothetical protein
MYGVVGTAAGTRIHPVKVAGQRGSAPCGRVCSAFSSSQVDCHPLSLFAKSQVLDKDGNGDIGSVVGGLDWVAANWDQFSPPIRVVSISLGGAL